jgi:hypothetical protein
MTWVRVKDKITGHEYSWLEPAEGKSLPDDMEVLDKPATNRFGVPLPPKPNRPLSSLVSNEGKPVESMTLDELNEYAARNSIDLEDATRKADVLEKIAAHPGSPAV